MGGSQPSLPDGGRLLLVEGVPGSGKTTTARWLAAWLCEQGVEATFHDELDPDHPVVPRALRRTGSDAGYADRCIAAWRRFAAAQARTRGVMVLEACLFQGTVRFLLEHEHPPADAERTLHETERALAPLRPRLLYFAAPDARGFLERDFPARKGKDWAGRIARYSETTPIARRHGWRGREGCVELYLAYRALCDRLVAGSTMPRLELDPTAPVSRIRARIRAFVGSRGGHAPTRSATVSPRPGG